MTILPRLSRLPRLVKRRRDCLTRRPRLINEVDFLNEIALQVLSESVIRNGVSPDPTNGQRGGLNDVKTSNTIGRSRPSGFAVGVRPGVVASRHWDWSSLPLPPLPFPRLRGSPAGLRSAGLRPTGAGLCATGPRLCSTRASACTTANDSSANQPKSSAATGAGERAIMSPRGRGRGPSLRIPDLSFLSERGELSGPRFCVEPLKRGRIAFFVDIFLGD